jgi:hypothetical protein
MEASAALLLVLLASELFEAFLISPVPVKYEN